MTDLSEGTKLCTNCQQKINLANFLIHEGFCLRNIQLCEFCHKPVNKNQKEEHFQQFHAKIKCECGEEVEKINLEAHKQETCKKRKADCIYCDLTLDFDKIQEHIDFCGSRTEKCSKCNQYVQFKDKNKHDATNCAYPSPQPQPKPNLPKTNVQQPRVPNYQPIQPPYFYNLNQRNNSENTRQNLEGNPETSSFSLLPCEFCNEFFMSGELIEHQNSCELNPIFSEETTVDPVNQHLNDLMNHNLNMNTPLQFYNQLMRNSNVLNAFGASHFGTTRNVLPNDENLSYMNYITNDDEEDDEEENAQTNVNDNDKIPCELCDELIDFENYEVHQLTCKYSEENLAAARNDIDPIISEYNPSNNEKKNDNEKAKINELELNHPVNRSNPHDKRRIEIPTSSKSILKTTRPITNSASSASSAASIKPAIKTSNLSNGIQSNSIIKKTEPFKPTTRPAGFVPFSTSSTNPSASSTSSTYNNKPNNTNKPSLESKPNGPKFNSLQKPK